MRTCPDTSNPTGPVTPAVVFEAPFAGVYVFVLVGNGGLYNLTETSNNGSSVDPRRTYLAYLEAEDQVTYVGPGALLAGARLGDELSDE